MSTQYKQIICLNGHQITDRANPGLSTTGFCEQCGASLISTCAFCDTPIKGYKSIDGVIDLTSYKEIVPKYCAYCGKPYPWTKNAIEAANELIELSDLNNTDKTDLAQSIPDLISDTPRTKLAVTKFKLYAKKAGSIVADGLHDILVDIASETVKKSLGL